MKRTIWECILVTLVLGLLLGVRGTGWSYEKWPLGLPSADRKVEKAVALEVVRKVALKKAKEVWGTVAQGPELAGCDLNGKVIVYIIPFRIGIGPFPDYEEIMEGVRESRRYYAEGLQELREQPEKEPLALKPDTKTSEKHNLGKDKRSGKGEYGTVVVWARSDWFPIPEYSECLPRYYTTGDLAQEKAQTVLGRGSIRLTRIYYAGPLDQLYEFTQGDRTILVDPFSLKIYSPEEITKVIPVPYPERKLPSDLEEEIKRAWAEAKK